MRTEKENPPEETLDPDDWESMRALGHRMMDDMFEYMRTVRGRYVWKHMPDEIKGRFSSPPPAEPQSAREVYEEFLQSILPYPVGNIHPRFWGWVLGTGTVMGALSELLAGSINTNTGGIDHHSANYVEKQVIDWFKELMSFPSSASGLLTSGCSAANLIGLAVARNTKAENDLRKKGLLQSVDSSMVLYASTEIHSSVQKAVELLGLGSNSLRMIPVNTGFKIDTEKLKEAIARDRESGHQPFCVVGAAGTTNTGAIDDLGELAKICKQEELWFHVDGAFGAWTVLSPELKDKVTGMEQADSLAFDLHKWMYMPYEIGCILIRSEVDNRRTFSLTPAYLSHGSGGNGMTGGDLPWFSDYGYQLSRGFRALKAWMMLKEQGTRKFGRLIRQNVEQARYLARLIEEKTELELATPVTLNVVCFRFVEPGLSDEQTDRINRQILVEVQERGVAAPSGTVINGMFFLHVANTNHRSRYEDFDLLVEEVIGIGSNLLDSPP
jgi:glutamate/tyrosine decarboxylase-like PLP-dependent enzyme